MELVLLSAHLKDSLHVPMVETVNAARTTSALTIATFLLASQIVTPLPHGGHGQHDGQPGVIQLGIPLSATGASIKHTTSFSSLSFEPAFW